MAMVSMEVEKNARNLDFEVFQLNAQGAWGDVQPHLLSRRHFDAGQGMFAARYKQAEQRAVLAACERSPHVECSMRVRRRLLDEHVARIHCFF